ncbi:MAG: hypothetical protein RI957_1020 [Verrucomicrobiota bacterium]|jgi:hypothetical protein
MKSFFSIFLLSLAPLMAQKKVHPLAGADQSSPALAQYFSWINNTNEGTTEDQTLANLGFFQWLRDEYGMVLDIYAFDAGFVDGKNFTAVLSESPRFREQFPEGLDRVYQTAKKMNTRLGHWGGPDGFGDTPESEQARVDMMVKLCRDYEWALYKFDLVCGILRPEKEASFIRMMRESRVHSPDLIALNHRLPLGEEGLSLMTTSLWDGQETYIDVHVANRVTAPHHRVGAMSRGNTENFNRLLEDHGVCISSCLDRFDDDLILQAFGRNLILAPEIYGNPWLLRDDEFAKLARIFQLARRYRDILIHAKALPEGNYGPHAVSRGDGKTRFITLRNLTWEPVTYTIVADEEVGLTKAKDVEIRTLHPNEKILAKIAFGSSQRVTVPPFRACLLMATTAETQEVSVVGCDYDVIRDVPGKPVTVRLAGMPGSRATVSLPASARKFSAATLDGKDVSFLLHGSSIDLRFDGDALQQPWHRKLAEAKTTVLPEDAEALYEATCFAADNNALEARSLLRSGPTQFPAVQAARDAFLRQRTFVGRGLWDRYLFDGDMQTSFFISKRWNADPRVNEEAMLRVDFGGVIQPEWIEFTMPDQFSLMEKFEGEGGSIAEVSADRKTWTSIPFIHGEKSRVKIPKGLPLRYVRIAKFQHRIAEVCAYANGKALPRDACRASNLFGSFRSMKFTKAWSAPITLGEVAEGSYLCVALEGKHGVEGAYVALRTADGKWIGAPDRSTSYPSNPWEFLNLKRAENYTYYIPLTPDLAGCKLEAVVLGCSTCDDSLRPVIWQTADEIPFRHRTLTLTPAP